MQPDLPARADVEAWLRARGPAAPEHKSKLNVISRWFGARVVDHSFELGPLLPIETGLCLAHVVFKAHAQDGLLPFPASPRGSFGVFTFDGEQICLLAPDDDSLERLLRAEAQPLQHAVPALFAQFVCDIRLARDRSQHVVLHSESQLGAPAADSVLARQQLDRQEFDRVRAAIHPPRITTTDDGGWTLEFATVFGGRAGFFQLATHELSFAADYSLSVGTGAVLSSQIFKTIAPVLT